MSSSLSPNLNDILPRCLVMIFAKEANGKKPPSDNGGLCVETHSDNDENISLFEDFIDENKGCFWDPHLEESLSSIVVCGVVFPNTVFVRGRDIHLDTIRRAWAKRVLRSPLHYQLLTVGEISGLRVESICQAQFTPLPEALCMIIADINKVGCVATFDTILEGLKLTHKGVHQPAEEMVYEALGTLIKERKIYHTGKGYHIITPELFAHLNHLNGCVTLHGKQSAIVLPYQTLPTSEMCSIACQTDALVEPVECEQDQMPIRKSRFQRSSSLKESKKQLKEKKLSRSNSMRFSDEKTNNSVAKDATFASRMTHQDKEKGEKKSVLNKLFGSKKQKSKAQLLHSIVSEIEQDNSLLPEEKPTAEYATFSAQFPPADMRLYTDRLLMLQPPPVYHLSQASKSRQNGRRPDMVDADTQSEIDEDWYKPCSMRKSKTLPENITGFSSFESVVEPRAKTLPDQGLQKFLSYRNEKTRRKSSSSRSPDSNQSCGLRSPIERQRSVDSKGSNNGQQSPHGVLSTPGPEEDSRFSKRRSGSFSKQYSHHDIDVRPRQRPCSVNLHSFCHGNQTTSVKSEDIYESIHERSIDAGTPVETRPLRPAFEFGDVTPEDNTLLPDQLSPGVFRHHFEEPSQRKRNLKTTTSNYVKNSSHKNRIYRKYRELCNTPTQESRPFDRATRPRRRDLGHVMHSRSCDSGVNCIGLQQGDAGNASPRDNIDLSEINPRDKVDLKRKSIENKGESSSQKKDEVKNGRNRGKSSQGNHRAAGRKTHMVEIHNIVENDPGISSDGRDLSSKKGTNEMSLCEHRDDARNRLFNQKRDDKHQSNDRSQIRSNQHQHNVNQNNSTQSRGKMGAVISSSDSNQMDSSLCMSAHSQEVHARKKVFLETDLDETVDSVPEFNPGINEIKSGSSRQFQRSGRYGFT